jgi:hypothetical protein
LLERFKNSSSGPLRLLRPHTHLKKQKKEFC